MNITLAVLIYVFVVADAQTGAVALATAFGGASGMTLVTFLFEDYLRLDAFPVTDTWYTSLYLRPGGRCD